MRLRRDNQIRRREIELLPLINIVMLLLVFFLVVGSIAPKTAGSLDLAPTRHAETLALPPDAIVLDADGVWRLDGQHISEAAVAERIARDGEGIATIAADRHLPAAMLAERLASLAGMGVSQVRLITEHQR